MPIDVAVRLIGSPGAIGTGRIRDVSATGAFVQTNLQLPLFALMHVEPIATSSNGREARRLAAYVARANSDGIGIEWCDFAPAAMDAFLFASREQAPAMARDTASSRRGFQ